jgi:hypothetical protein
MQGHHFAMVTLRKRLGKTHVNILKNVNVVTSEYTEY